MDHRCNKRHSICLPIQVSSKKLGVIDIFAENISIEGAFVNLAAHNISVDSIIKVRLQMMNKLLELNSYVAHKNNSGAGLLFEYCIPVDDLFYPGLTCTQTLRIAI